MNSNRAWAGVCALGIFAAACSASEGRVFDPIPDATPAATATPEPSPVDGECTLSEDCIGAVTPSGPCEVPVCEAQTRRCVLQALSDGTQCDDGDPCTLGDACAAGSCQSGEADDCDDGDPCTDDVCLEDGGCGHTPNTATCDDGSACTSGDTCRDGTCRGAPIDCDDRNPCTDDLCDAGTGCRHENNEAPCDDANACSTGERCEGGACVGGSAVDCDDGNACTDERCDLNMGCVVTPNTEPCDDGNACTEGERCDNGLCRPSRVIDCSDGDPCTLDSCDRALGCQYSPSTAPCDDGDVCTLDDQCQDGRCVGGAALSCDDGNACTDDLCRPDRGCLSTPNNAPCDDGNSCTDDDRCILGGCGAGVGVCECEADADCAEFDDGDACNGTLLCDRSVFPFRCRVDPATVVQCPAMDPTRCQRMQCVPATGECVVGPRDDGTLCDDGSACTRADACVSGTCEGALVDCDDGNPCTVDGCSPATGCVSSPGPGACDDGDDCTLFDQCLDGLCVSGAPPDCDDNNPCTDDSCIPQGGCLNLPREGSCEDGSVCTAGDSCVDGVCESGEDVDCEDGNPCTSHLCNPFAGCIQRFNDNPCDDGDLCSESDRCGGGVCLPGRPLRCEDDNPCTDGVCVDGQCSFTEHERRCDDGDACTRFERCDAGACVSTDPGPLCDDENPCTDDACGPAGVGCFHTSNGSCEGCEGVSCLACASGQSCGPSSDIPGTCCSVGDAIQYLGRGHGDEVVDLETDGRFAYLCGGFGLRVNDVSNPAQPRFVTSATRRCQRVTIGPELPNGNRVIYIAHHGDSWVRTPFLGTWHRQPDGSMTEIDKIEDSQVLFEGLRYHQGHLYVAAHSGGLRVYSVDAGGVPQFLRQVSGFTNAWKIDIAGDVAYVADGGGGLAIVDLGDPAAPRLLTHLPTPGLARDVEHHGGRVYVAMGGAGVEVFDATANPFLPTPVRTLDPMGSAQAVAADGNLLAVAAWTQVTLFDTATFSVLGTEEVRRYPNFDQVLGVDLRGDIIYVGEWEGLHTLQYRQGYAAPDLWIVDDLVSFNPHGLQARALVVRNRGSLDLEISDIEVSDSLRYSVSPQRLVLPPGGADIIEVSFDPGGQPGGPSEERLRLITNDPDANQSPFDLFLIAEDSANMSEGDPLTPQFGFLDPNGAGQVDGLRGHVTLLAYFALF